MTNSDNAQKSVVAPASHDPFFQEFSIRHRSQPLFVRCIVILHIAEGCLVPPLDPLREAMGMFCGGTPTEAHTLQLYDAVEALNRETEKADIREIRSFGIP